MWCVDGTVHESKVVNRLAVQEFVLPDVARLFKWYLARFHICWRVLRKDMRDGNEWWFRMIFCPSLYSFIKHYLYILITFGKSIHQLRSAWCPAGCSLGCFALPSENERQEALIFGLSGLCQSRIDTERGTEVRYYFHCLRHVDLFSRKEKSCTEVDLLRLPQLVISPCWCFLILFPLVMKDILFPG